VDELAYRPLRDPERRGQLGTSQAVQRATEQRLALMAGETLQSGHDRASARPTFGHGLKRLAAGVEFFQWRLDRSVGASCRVAQNRVQPPPRMADLGATGQCGICAEERLLDDVLGAAVGPQAPCLGQQLGSVALDEDREGSLVPVAREA
jgi:hypothetical protein